MINDLLSQMAHAQKMSIADIQKGIQSGTIDAYVGIPLIQKKTAEAKKLQMAQALFKEQGEPNVNIKDQVMQAADQVTRPEVPPSPTPPATDRQQPAPSMGIEAARSNMPTQYAGGGIIAFNGEDGSVVPGDYALEKLKAAGYDPETAGAGPGDVLGWMGRKAGDIGRGISDAVFLEDPTWASRHPSQKEYYKTTQPSPSRARELAAPDTLVKGRQDVQSNAPSWMDKLRNWVAPADEEALNPAITKEELAARRQANPPKLKVEGRQSSPAPSDGIRSIDMASGMTPAPAAVNQALSPDTSMQDMISESRKSRQDLRDLILGQGAEDAAKKDRNLGTALMTAGFGIMGGRSPFASVNIGEGAMRGVESYSKGLEQLDNAKQARVKQLVDLGLKGEELDKALMQLGITKDYYDAHAPMFSAQARYYDAKAQEEGIKAALYPQVVQAKLARAAGAGGGGKGYLGAANLKSLKEMYSGYSRDPQSSPAFNQLDRRSQMVLSTIKDPNNPTYRSAKQEFDKINNRMFQNDLSEAWQASRRSTSFDPSQYSLD